jgi:NitT/TauT family transport system substrate-binding protein
MKRFVPRFVIGILLCCAVLPARAEDIAVAQYGNAVNAMPYAVALEKHFFQQAGADVTGVIGSNGGGGDMRNLLAGKLPYVETALPPVIAAFQKGADIAIVSDNVLSAASFALVAMTDSPVLSVRDLKGRRIGFSTAGSTTQAFEIWLLDKLGYQPGDVTLVATGGFGPGLTALEHGGVDLTVGTLPAILSAPGKYRTVIAGQDTLPPVANTVGVVLRPLARAHPEMVRGIIAGRRAAVAFMEANRGEAAAIIGQAFKLEPAVVEACLHRLIDEGKVDGVPYWGTGRFDYAGIENMIHAARLNGMVEGDVDMKKLVDESYLPDDLRSPGQ